jgi:hypothetical protein
MILGKLWLPTFSTRQRFARMVMLVDYYPRSPGSFEPVFR